MEQMLKLCMFLMRAKLTFMEAIEYRDSDCMQALCWLLWALHLCTKCTVKKEKKKMFKVCIVSQCSNHGLNTSVVYIQGHWKLKICGTTLVMHQGWPLPPCHISSENLTWRVYIGFLHLPFKPLWANWRWGELRLLSPVSLRSFSLCTPSQMSTFG